MMVRMCGEARPAAPREKGAIMVVNEKKPETKSNVKSNDYLKWKDLPPQVKNLYTFLFKEFMEGMSYAPDDNEGVGSITSYLKDIISTHNELMYKKFEFLSFLGTQPTEDKE